MASKNAPKSSKSSKSSRRANGESSRMAKLGYRNREEMMAAVRNVKLDDGAKIKVLVKENPKRGKSAKRFSLYKTGMTVASALDKGLWRGDLKWDAAHKFIALSKH